MSDRPTMRERQLQGRCSAEFAYPCLALDGHEGPHLTAATKDRLRIASLETALAEEREKNKRLREALEGVARVHHSTLTPSQLHRSAPGEKNLTRPFEECPALTCCDTRAALASTGSEAEVRMGDD